jgi:prepilin-type N-terminal cleavage/methylation domain-containing protein
MAVPPPRGNLRISPRMRRAFTLVELIVVCTILAVAAGVALPRSKDLLDGLRVRQAAHEVSGAVALTRVAAIRRGQVARLIVDRSAGSIRVETGNDTLLTRPLQTLHDVQLRATRDTVTFGANGLGVGVANSTITVSIGARAETVVVSRMGRARVSY